MVDVPFVDFLPSLLPRLPQPTARYVMTLPSKNLLARFIHNHLPSSLLLPMNHTFFVILWVTILHHTYTEMQRPLVCHLYILEAGIHTRFPLLKACAGKNDKNERESENKV